MTEQKKCCYNCIHTNVFEDIGTSPSDCKLIELKHDNSSTEKNLYCDSYERKKRKMAKTIMFTVAISPQGRVIKGTNDEDAIQWAKNHSCPTCVVTGSYEVEE